MLIKAPRVTAVAAILLISSQADAGNTSLEAGVSTLGIGITGSYRVMDNIALRGQFSHFKYGFDFDDDDIKYDADLKLTSFGVIADWHVIDGSGFRVSAGAYYNGNELEGKGSPKSGSNFIIGGTPYTLDRLDAEVEFNHFSPYLGIGWTSGSATEEGFVFSADLGVLYQGSPDVSLKASGTGTSNPTFSENLKKEEKRVEDELKSFKWYPVASISIGYRF